MTHIIRDTDFKTWNGEGLWPGMWVHNMTWRHPRRTASPLDACYLWCVEQHDGVMMLAGQGEEIILPLTPEIAENCVLFRPAELATLADYPTEWAALRKLGWGVYLSYRSRYDSSTALALSCERGYQDRNFWVSRDLAYQAVENPEIIRTLLKTAWWRLKHPKYANALAGQQPREFWDWPNAPDLKQLHQMGLAAWKTEEGKIEIGPDGNLKATGRKAWEFPLDEQE